ncbi:MAG: hypothetical protein ACLQVG_16370 [Terriglobia bacterium]
MKCPQCGAPTEVSEKRGPFRDRRCTSNACGLSFTTREQVVRPRKQEVRPGEHGRLCARTRAIQGDAPTGIPAARMAAGAAPDRPGMPDLTKGDASDGQQVPPLQQARVGA